MIDFLYEYTVDDIELQGTYFNSLNKDVCVLFVHGQAQSILNNSFAYNIGKLFLKRGISFLYGHNRGYSYINCLNMKNGDLRVEGATFEIFDDCLKDIDVWINKIKSLGYKKIILMGHSLGCNKALYYAYVRKNISGLIFASAPDMVGITKNEEKDFDKLLKLAKNNVDTGNGRRLLDVLIGGTDYISSYTFISENTEGGLIDNFPIERNPEVFSQLSEINIPILSFAGSEEYKTYLKQDLLKEKAIKCESFVYKIINNTNHFYDGKSDEVAALIIEWINSVIR